MANATISGHTGIKNGNFPLMVAFTEPITSVTGFDDADITITAVSGNGITGVTFEVTGRGADYHITFQLPEDVQGSFRVTISGMVTVEGGSGPEAVMANSPVVTYNNITNVPATFGTVEYRDNGVLAIPMTFGVAVTAPSKTICRFANPSEDAGDGIAAIEDFYIVGENTAYALIVQIAEEKKGSFILRFEGDVLKSDTMIWDNVTNNQPLADRTFAYDTRAPRIVAYDIPANYTEGENFDVRLAYNLRVTGLSDNNVHQVFILEGAANMMGTPTPYKWVGASPPDFNAAVPDDLTGTDWQQLTSPPAGVPTTAENDFDENGFWHGAANEGQYFLIRWVVAEGTTGIFNMTPLEGMLRGQTGG
ncbi:hypothetical protein C6499_22505 [Candidatus Poribacteria bacterium]|nr:MAG: hypothetical protein C6499_22505 [Candidatus Poribacteria bacterium]